MSIPKLGFFEKNFYIAGQPHPFARCIIDTQTGNHIRTRRNGLRVWHSEPGEESLRLLRK